MAKKPKKMCETCGWPVYRKVTDVWGKVTWKCVKCDPPNGYFEPHVVRTVQPKRRKKRCA